MLKVSVGESEGTKVGTGVGDALGAWLAVGMLDGSPLG